MSTDYANKLRAIRKTEGLTQLQFAEITGLCAGTIRNYEANHKAAKSLTAEKVLKVKRFQKYTMCLMTESTNPESGQVAPFFTVSESKVKTPSSALKKEKALLNLTEQERDKGTKTKIVKNISHDNFLRLAKLLYEEGVGFLLECLEPEDKLFLSLPRDKKSTLLELESMSTEQLREALSKIEANSNSTQGVDTSKKNPAD